jgi:thiol-disulfide isomerase/thioredoxin
MSRLFLLIVLLGACTTASPAVPADDANAPFPAPDFALAGLDEQTYHLSDLRGRWVLLNFWATWCVPCVTELPALQQIAARYTDRLTILAINLREPVEQVASFVAERGLTFPILVAPDDQTILNYNVIGLPQTLIVNPAGEVVYREFGPINVETFDAQLAAWVG